MARKLTTHARSTTHGGSWTAGSMRYHQTTVVQWDQDTITLDTGGWKTATTKIRMNQCSDTYALRFAVFSKKREWFVRYHGVIWPIHGRVITLARQEPASTSEIP